MILNMAPYMTAYTAPETILSPSQATNGITEKNVSKETNGMNGNTKDSGSKADAIESIETSSKIGSSTSKSSTISADTKNDTTATVRSTSPDRWPAMNYHLSSVIVHKGQMDTGHYVNYTREGNEWFLFDDSKVTMVNESEVLKAEAYILVYVTSDVVSGTDE
jgi:uncharacterized UBP type Zn finger protein